MTAENKTRITTDVDYDADGKQLGFLRLPHSVHRSAYGWIAIPICVIKNGDGPTILLTAGNHGDEYEGQFALMKLCRELQTEDVRGRVIIVTAANFPAVLGGLRTSPIDDLNLNRTFPGDPQGRPTEAIAHYLETELLTRADYLVDLHSGGSSLLYIPSAIGCRSDDSRITQRAERMIRAFAAPLTYYALPRRETRTFIAAAERYGVAYLGTELGGAGMTTVESVRVGDEGVRRVLRELEIVPEIEVVEPTSATRLMEICSPDYYVFAPDYGIWEPLVDLGDDVIDGQLAARVHCPRTPWREPADVHFTATGTVICRRVPGPVDRGDCIFHLATDV